MSEDGQPEPLGCWLQGDGGRERVEGGGEWAHWRGPQEKEYRGGAHPCARFLSRAGVGPDSWCCWYPGSHTPGPVLPCLVQPERDPAGQRWSPGRRLFSLPEHRLHQHHLLRQRTLHRLVPAGLDAFRHIWFVSRPGPPWRRAGPPCLGRPGSHSFFSNLQTKNRSDTCD